MAAEITHTDWTKLYVAFQKYGNVNRAAAEVGLSFDAAQRYIVSGNQRRGLRPIRDLIQEENEKTLEDLRSQRANDLRLYYQMARSALGQQVETFRKIKVEPKGKKLPDGKTQIDSREFGRVLKNSVTIHDLQSIVYDENIGKQHDEERIGVTVNVANFSAVPSTQAGREQMSDSILKLEKRYLTEDERKLSTTDRTRILATKVAKARIQTRTATIIEEED